MENADAIEEVNEGNGSLYSSRNEFPIVINENFFSDFSIFPPDNHEDLLLLNPRSSVQPRSPESFSSSTSSSSSPSSCSDEDENERKGMVGEVRKLWNTCLGFVGYKIARMVHKVRKQAASRVGYSSAGVMAVAVAAVVVGLLCTRLRRWRRKIQHEIEMPLMLLIREKNQKINQLMLQIAQMNELLKTRRRVPVTRIG